MKDKWDTRLTIIFVFLLAGGFWLIIAGLVIAAEEFRLGSIFH